ncbi:MAG: GGDEF domain-containing protein [Planctomycetota bacterium]
METSFLADILADMANPEFRKGSSGGGKGSSLSGRFAQGGVVGSPFSQAQILHLMKTEFARGRRYEFPVSCILIQVDRLTQLTDLHGARLSEAVRHELSKLVSTKTRGADHLGLVSDERYLLVLPHTDEPSAVGVAERIQEAFGMLEVESGGTALKLTLSIGIASSSDQQTMFFDTILSQAEEAMQWAIEAGGNQAMVFQPDRGRKIVEEDVPEDPGHSPSQE